MKLTYKNALVTVAGLALGATLVAAPLLAGSVLTIDGKQVSNRVRVIDGESWVPVRDIANAQGLTVTSSGGQINLVTAGGANQVGSLTGKIGSMLFDGHWKFGITKFEQVASYKITTKTSTDYGVTNPVSNIEDDVITPKTGFKLYVADCTLKNGMTHGAQFEWSPNSGKTAIADAAGESHPWLVWDIASEAFVTKEMLPGSALNFKICFAVPEAATPQDVVVTLLTLGDKAGTDIRIHVAGDNS